jgi:hypothetical protein
MEEKKKKVVVAFSGGLDTSFTVMYLAAFATFNCFKSRDKVAWVNRNPSFANSCNNSSWLPTSLLEIIILMASSLLFLLFILHNYSDSTAKLQNIREYRYKKENIFATLCIFSIKLLSIIPRVNQNHTKFFFSMRSS